MTRLDRMKSYLPEHFSESREIIAILEDGNDRFEDATNVMDDVLNQFFVETATWGLSKWEDELDVQLTVTDIEARRSHIISKLTGHTPTHYRAIEIEVNRFLKSPTSTVRLIDKEYAFEITIPANDLLKPKVDMENAVEEMKPAHLRMEIVAELLGGIIKAINDSYSYPVYYRLTGQFWGEKEFTQVETIPLKLIDDTYHYAKEYPTTKKGSTVIESIATTVIDDTYSYVKEYRKCGEMDTLDKGVNLFESTNELIFGSYNYKKTYRLTGQFSCEG